MCIPLGGPAPWLLQPARQLRLHHVLQAACMPQIRSALWAKGGQTRHQHCYIENIKLELEPKPMLLQPVGWRLLQPAQLHGSLAVSAGRPSAHLVSGRTIKQYCTGLGCSSRPLKCQTYGCCSLMTTERADIRADIVFYAISYKCQLNTS